MQLEMRRLAIVLTVGIALVGAAAHAVLAQANPIADAGEAPAGVRQEVLVDAPLTQLPGKRIRVFRGTIEPGASTALHRHPGTEVFYVLAGEGRMEIEGRASRELKPGTALLVEPEPGASSLTHRAVNGSAENPLQTLVVVLHDEGTRPSLPVK